MEEQTGFTANCQVLPKGELLFAAGSTPEYVYKLESGEVGVYQGGELLATLRPGNFLGADAGILQEPLRYSVRGIAAPASWLNQYALHDFTHAFTANEGLAALVSESLDTIEGALQRHRRDRESDPTRRIAVFRQQMKVKAQRIFKLLEERG